MIIKMISVVKYCHINNIPTRLRHVHNKYPFMHLHLLSLYSSSINEMSMKVKNVICISCIFAILTIVLIKITVDCNYFLTLFKADVLPCVIDVLFLIFHVLFRGQ